MSDSSKNIVEFTLVYNRNKAKLYNYARKMISDRMVCEDIIQNVFLKFFENMYRIKNSERVEVWLFTTTRNAIFTFFRNRKTHVDQFGVADADEMEIKADVSLSDEYENVELKEMIARELKIMAPEQSEVFLLKEYGGLSYKEISNVMNIDEELVKSRLYKTRQKLIDKLSKVIMNERQL